MQQNIEFNSSQLNNLRIKYKVDGEKNIKVKQALPSQVHIDPLVTQCFRTGRPLGGVTLQRKINGDLSGAATCRRIVMPRGNISRF